MVTRVFICPQINVRKICSSIPPLQRPGKDPKEQTSYHPISLLSIVNKIFEELLLRRINTDLKPDDWMPPHQFGFRNQHSTQQQTHRIIHTVHQALEDKQYCTVNILRRRPSLRQGLACRTPLQDQKGVPYSILQIARVISI
jgi:hypothetical protein